MASRNLTVNINVADLPQVKAMFEKAKEEVERLRTALNEDGDERVDYLLRDSNECRRRIDDALALHRLEKRYHDGSAEWSTDDPSEIAEEHDYPLDEVPYFEVCAHCGEIEMSQSDHASYLESMWPCATVRALAPVADPDPHTTSDEETSDG